MKRTLSTNTLATLAVTLSLVFPPMVSAKKPGGGGGGDTSPQYSIVQLDDSDAQFVGRLDGGAHDINQWGHVVGSVADAVTGTPVAAFWEVSGANSRIVPLASGTDARGLNNWNEIVGSDGGDASYWSSPYVAPVTLPPLEAGLAAVAYAINDDGVICGYARQRVVDGDGNVSGSTDVAVAWRVTFPNNQLQIAGPVPLPTLDDRSQAYAIGETDESGAARVAGVYMTTGHAKTAAVQWTVQSQASGTISVDPTPHLLEIGDAAAFGVNNLGVSCGQALLSSTEPKAQVWLGGSGLTLLDPPGIPHYVGWPLHKALDVNDAGTIVGSAGAHAVFRDAVVWPSAAEEPVLLSKFLPKRNSPFTYLQEATAINGAGAIVGVGGNGADQLPYLAIPQ